MSYGKISWAERRYAKTYFITAEDLDSDDCIDMPSSDENENERQVPQSPVTSRPDLEDTIFHADPFPSLLASSDRLFVRDEQTEAQAGQDHASFSKELARTEEGSQLASRKRQRSIERADYMQDSVKRRRVDNCPSRSPQPKEPGLPSPPSPPSLSQSNDSGHIADWDAYLAEIDALCEHLGEFMAYGKQRSKS